MNDKNRKRKKAVPLSCELRSGHRLAGLLVDRQPGRRCRFLGQTKGASGPPPCSHCGPGFPGPLPGDKTIRGAVNGEDPALQTSVRPSRTVPGPGAQQRRRDWKLINGEKISPSGGRHRHTAADRPTHGGATAQSSRASSVRPHPLCPFTIKVSFDDDIFILPGSGLTRETSRCSNNKIITFNSTAA